MSIQERQTHLEYLDVLRGVAILIVFVFHCLGPTYGFHVFSWPPWGGENPPLTPSVAAQQALTLGRYGVALFFVISGFCIHLSFAQGRRQDFRTFFLRRFFRIVPAYLLAIFFAYAVHMWRLKSPGLMIDWEDLLHHVLFIHNLSPEHIYRINPAFWSIATEVQLYLIYPLFWCLLQRFGMRVALGTAFVTEISVRGWQVLGTAGLTPLPPFALVESPLGYWFSWCMGAYLAESWMKGRATPLLWVHPLWWVVPFTFTHFERVSNGLCFLFASILSASVVARFQVGRIRLPRWSTVRALASLGVVSYGLYLIHHVVLVTAMFKILSAYELSRFAAFATAVLLLLPLALLSWVIYVGVERPGILLGRKLESALLAARKEGARAREEAADAELHHNASRE